MFYLSSTPLELTVKGEYRMTRKDYVMIADAIRGAINFETEFRNNEIGADALKKLSVALALTSVELTWLSIVVPSLLCCW